MDCPICGSVTQRIFQKNGYWILECERCRHRCAEMTPSADHVERIYDDHYFQGGKDGYPDYLGEVKILTASGRRYGALIKKYMEPGKVLDVGCAAGFILRGFQDCGWEAYGVEPNPQMSNYARNHLGLQVQTGEFETYSSDKPYDLISMIQVLPHFFDLRRALQVAAEITKPEGFWLVETWNKESLTARLMGKNWHEYSPPRVLHWFSRKGLEELFMQFGFKEIAIGRPAKKISTAHIKSLLQYTLGDIWWGRVAIRMSNIIPANMNLLYPGDDIFWALYQKS